MINVMIWYANLGPSWPHVCIFKCETETIERDGSVNRSLSGSNVGCFQGAFYGLLCQNNSKHLISDLIFLQFFWEKYVGNTFLTFDTHKEELTRM